MKIVVDVPDEEYESYALAITFGMGSTAIRRILDGTPLPEGAEILTAEAYSDLCLRASNGRKTGKWITQNDKNKKLYGWHICSECGAICGSKPNYCSECGAKMEGAEE